MLDYNLKILQELNVLIIPDREEESTENVVNENPEEDAGYPQSPGSDVPESAFSNPNRVCQLLLHNKCSEHTFEKRWKFLWKKGDRVIDDFTTSGRTWTKRDPFRGHSFLLKGWPIPFTSRKSS